MDGLILVNKPSGYTSHDVIINLRKAFHTQRIGHFGTLDPLATGLLIVAVGNATRLFPFFSKADKLYTGQITLGFSTDTYDSEGKPTSPEVKEWPKKDALLETMKRLEGEIEQIPPLFSAKKYRGKPLYTLARRKKELPLKPCRVFIYFFRLRRFSPPLINFEVECSSGTYIRSLAHDLGQILGCGAHLSALERVETGGFKLSEAHTLEEIKEHTKEGKMEQFFIPIESILPQFPKIILTLSGSLMAKNGNMIYPESILKVVSNTPEKASFSRGNEAVFRLFNEEGKLLAFARKGTEDRLHPFLVMS